MRTRSPSASLRTIAPYTQGIGAKRPGQSESLCGQPSHVASWGSHSAGMRQPPTSASGATVVTTGYSPSSRRRSMPA